jgi:hypothetical protein
MPVLNHPAAKWDTSTALRQTDDRKHRRPLQAKSDVELSIGVAASTTTALDSALSVEASLSSDLDRKPPEGRRMCG